MLFDDFMQLTTMLSSTPTLQFWISLVIAWDLDGVLWRLHFTGSAASVARFKYNEQLSVGDGCKLDTAFLNIYRRYNIIKFYNNRKLEIFTSSGTLGSNFDLIKSYLICDKCLSCPIISTGVCWGSHFVSTFVKVIFVVIVKSYCPTNRNVEKMRVQFYLNKHGSISGYINIYDKNKFKYRYGWISFHLYIFK